MKIHLGVTDQQFGVGAPLYNSLVGTNPVNNRNVNIFRYSHQTIYTAQPPQGFTDADALQNGFAVPDGLVQSISKPLWPGLEA
jgi:hypothetical protein